MRANFLVIMTDDQGAWARGRTMPELVTPTIDALGAEGREFDNFFCASPVCSPARASVLTGRMPSAHGVHDWLHSEAQGRPTTGLHYLRDVRTTPQILRENGYICGHSGKWHLGDARVVAPGFHHWFAHRDGGGPYYGAPVVEHGEEQIEDRYITDAITDRAEEMIRGLTAGPEPFYLQVHYTAPHAPWTPNHHPHELLDLYRDCDFPSVPIEEPHPWFDGSGALGRACRDRITSLRGYCAALSGVDRGVRRLVNALEASGRREETYVIFTSDNGFSCGQHGFWGKGNGTWPLNVWEPSIKVPFIVNRPGVVRPGVDPWLTSAVSLHPTILELAGIEVPKDPLAAGTSFAHRLSTGEGRLNTRDSDDGQAVVAYDEYGGTRMIRTSDHKYVMRREGPEELFDLVGDPDEQHNLAGERRYGDLQRALEVELRTWFARHSETAFDGFDQPVTGKGQRSPVWGQEDGRARFVERPRRQATSTSRLPTESSWF